MKTIEQNIMARVKRIYYLRKVFQPTLLKVYGFGVLATVLTSVVSLTNVYANMPPLTAPTAFANFFFGALAHTELFVQVLLIGLVVTICMLGRDFVYGVGNTHPFVHV